MEIMANRSNKCCSTWLHGGHLLDNHSSLTVSAGCNAVGIIKRKVRHFGVQRAATSHFKYFLYDAALLHLLLFSGESKVQLIKPDKQNPSGGRKRKCTIDERPRTCAPRPTMHLFDDANWWLINLPVRLLAFTTASQTLTFSQRSSSSSYQTALFVVCILWFITQA